MKHTIINKEFRDYASESMYPFSDLATLTNDQDVTIVPEVFLDALIYSVDDVEQPFYLAELKGTIGTQYQMGVVIRDNNNREVCTGIINVGTYSVPLDTCYLYDSFDRVAGTLVYDSDHMSQLIRRVDVFDFIYSKSQTPFLAERGYVTRSGGLSVAKAASNTFPNNLNIVGANGVHFTEEDGEVYCHLLGEENIGRLIKTVNSVELTNVWLAAHTESAIKVETLNNSIKIRKISDAD